MIIFQLAFYEDRFINEVKFGQHIKHWLLAFPHLLIHCYHVFSTFSRNFALNEFYKHNEKFKRPINFKLEETAEKLLSLEFNDSKKKLGSLT